jgi:hypothetical protein
MVFGGALFRCRALKKRCGEPVYRIVNWKGSQYSHTAAVEAMVRARAGVEEGMFCGACIRTVGRASRWDWEVLVERPRENQSRRVSLEKWYQFESDALGAEVTVRTLSGSTAYDEVKEEVDRVVALVESRSKRDRIGSREAGSRV